MKGLKVEDYKLFRNGHFVRIATKVIFEDGIEIRFITKVSKKRAIENAVGQRSR